MANTAHSSLAGADLHEPKGIASASADTVYVADGVGSGAWSSGSSLLAITGMIADFAIPIAPTGWLECDGSAVSRSTYATLFAALTIQQTGTRTSGSAIVTGLSSTTNMKVGYYLSGTGISTGTTILTVDSATQITMSATATSSGSATVVVSPFELGDGSTTFTLPDTKKRYRRGRDVSNAVHMGTAQAEAINSHTHSVTVSGSTAAEAAHTHSVSGTSGNQSQDHTHSINFTSGAGSAHSHGSIAKYASLQSVESGSNESSLWKGEDTVSTGSESSHTHPVSGNTGNVSQNHNHTFSATSGAGSSHLHTMNFSVTSAANGSAGTETRPLTIVIMTCIKT